MCNEKVDQMKVLVLGGNGFIGRNIANKLKLQGANVLISSRKVVSDSDKINIFMQEMLQMNDWLTILLDVDVVVNSVGILRERKGECYENVQTLAPIALAQACAKLDVRLIHISAIGLSLKAKSRFIRSKFNGEQGILASNAKAIIVRPSLLDGDGGFGAKWFRRVAAWRVQGVMQTQGLIAPLQVTDLGEAVANMCFMDFEKLPKVIELGGNDILSIPQYLTKLRLTNYPKPATQLTVPKVMVRIISHIFDVFAFTPLSFGHFELMQGYNVPQVNYLPKLLGRRPSAVGLCGAIGWQVKLEKA